MPTYHVILERTITEWMSLRVEAGTREEAERAAEEDPYKWPEMESGTDKGDAAAWKAVASPSD